MVAGSTPDISAYCLFDWYQPVYFHTPTQEFPYQKIDLGRWIGVADDVCTDVLASYVLKQNGDTVIRKSIWAVDPDELMTAEFEKKLIALDAQITDSIGGYHLKSQLRKTLMPCSPPTSEKASSPAPRL